VSNFGALQITARITKLQDAVQQIHGQAMQPPPFVYVHLLYVMTWLYLPLFAAILGFNQDSFGINDPHPFCIGLITVIVNCIFSSAC
jgi:hypothetical protein